MVRNGTVPQAPREVVREIHSVDLFRSAGDWHCSVAYGRANPAAFACAGISRLSGPILRVPSTGTERARTPGRAGRRAGPQSPELHVRIFRLQYEATQHRTAKGGRARQRQSKPSGLPRRCRRVRPGPPQRPRTPTSGAIRSCPQSPGLLGRSWGLRPQSAQCR